MREGRRFILGFYLLVTIVLLGLSGIPLVHADEADVDAAGNVQADEPELYPPSPSDHELRDDGIPTAKETIPKPTDWELDPPSPSDHELRDDGTPTAKEYIPKPTDWELDPLSPSATAKDRAMGIVDKVKEVTPEQMKKVAAGALGIWGVAAGAGWVINNLGGAQD